MNFKISRLHQCNKLVLNRQLCQCQAISKQCACYFICSLNLSTETPWYSSWFQKGVRQQMKTSHMLLTSVITNSCQIVKSLQKYQFCIVRFLSPFHIALDNAFQVLTYTLKNISLQCVINRSMQMYCTSSKCNSRSPSQSLFF